MGLRVFEAVPDGPAETSTSMLRDRGLALNCTSLGLHLHDPKGPAEPSGDMCNQFLVIPLVMSGEVMLGDRHE